jgi:hypothetical protein
MRLGNIDILTNNVFFSYRFD